MQSAIFRPTDPRLQAHIEYFWFLTSHSDEKTELSILPPEATFEIILSFAAPTILISRQSEHQIELKSSFLSGMRTEPFRLGCQGRVEYVAIRFYPQGMSRFLPMPLDEITAVQALDLDVLDGRGWRHLTARLAETPDMPGKIAQLEQELLTILTARSTSSSWLVAGALDQIHAAKGTVNIQPLCAQLGTYPKRLEREFKYYLGVTPKFYSRLLRFNHVFNYINRCTTSIDWADLVYTFGYFDQSHFIKDFTQFLGYSPETYQTLRQKVAPLA